MSIDQALIDLEHDGWRALSEGAGASFYERNLTDDAVMVFPGMAMDRKESIAAMAAAPPWLSFKLEDAHVIELSPTSAVLTYKATAEREGQDPYSAHMTSVYVKQGDAWKMAFHQQSP